MPLPWSAKELKSMPPMRLWTDTKSKPPSSRKLDKQRKSPDARLLRVLEAGTHETSEPELQPLRQRAFGVLQDLTTATIQRATLETLSATEVMYGRVGRAATLTDLIVEARGLKDAVETKIGALQYRLGAASGGWMTTVYLTETPAKFVRAMYVEDWLTLRHAVVRASNDIYEEARDFAESTLPSLPLEHQARVAYVFPDEPWGQAVLASPDAAQTRHASRAGSPSTVTTFGFLLTTCRNPEAALAVAATKAGAFAISQHALSLARLLPDDDALRVFEQALPPLLVRKKRQTFHKTPPRNVLAAITKLDADGVAQTVALYVGDAVLGPLAAQYFQDCPAERSVLADHGKAAQALAETLKPLAEEHTSFATSADLPRLLRERRWRPKGSRKPIKRIPNVPVLSAHQERTTPNLPPASALALLEGEQLDAWRKDIASGRGCVNMVWDRNDRVQRRVPPDEALAAWNEGRGWLGGPPIAFVAEHSLEALPGFLLISLQHFDYEGADGWINAIRAFESPRIAVLWASLLLRRKAWRSVAARWFQTHASIAAEGLIPVVLGSDNKLRKDAEYALVFLLSTGHRDEVALAISAHAPNVQSALAPILSRDTRVLDQKPPKPPPFLRADALPPLKLRDTHKTLGPENQDALLELLSITPTHYLPLIELQESFDQESLSGYCDALLEQWARQHGPGRHAWMMYASLALKSSTASKRIGSLARGWARNKGAAAARACETLADIGDEEALLHLAHIAATTRFSALRKQTDASLNRIASARNLTRDVLEDRCVPGLGLNENGLLPLSFGDHKLTATLKGLDVVLLGNDQQPLRSFPRQAKGTQDPHRKEAKERYDQLKKQTRMILDRTCRRLERAMVDGRTWTLKDASRFFFTHPLLQHLARGLVWRVRDRTSVRLTLDGTFANVDDEDVQLPVDAEISIAHVLELDRANEWGTLFGDHELLQPFPQLGRQVFSLTETENATVALARCKSLETRGFKLLGALESRGWRRNDPGSVSQLRRHAARSPSIQLTLSFTPSVDLAYRDTEALVRTTGLVAEKDGRAVPFSCLDPISISEILRDIDTVIR